MTSVGVSVALEALQLGWDSLIAGTVVGFFLARWPERLIMAVLFGACDELATLLGGALFGHAIDLPNLVPFAILFAAVALALQGWRNWLWISPFIFSVDNLLSLAPPGHVAWLGCSSGLLALAGMSLARTFALAGRAMLRQSSARRVRLLQQFGRP